MFGKRIWIGLSLVGFLLGACEKKENTIPLPEPSSSQIGEAIMGADYKYTVFYDLESNQEVKRSVTTSWDLAFEASEDGYRVFMNGAISLQLHVTSMSDPANVDLAFARSLTNMEWLRDAPSGHRDSTGLGDWRGLPSSNLILVKLSRTDASGISRDEYYNLRMLHVDASKYEIAYGKVGEASLKKVTLEKDPAYNFIYFSLNDGVVDVAPPKDAYDLEFTRYRYIYRDFDANGDYGYIVTGVLTNYNNTLAARIVDGISYDEMDKDKLDGLSLSENRDVIGHDWKTYIFDAGRYEVHTNLVFVLKTHRNNYYKMRILKFYGSSGEPGSPSFEFIRIN